MNPIERFVKAHIYFANHATSLICGLSAQFMKENNIDTRWTSLRDDLDYDHYDLLYHKHGFDIDAIRTYPVRFILSFGYSISNYSAIHITLDDVDAFCRYIDINDVNWEELTTCRMDDGVGMKLLDRYPDKEWNWFYIMTHWYLTEEYIESRKYKWKWSNLVYNQSLPIEYIYRKNPRKVIQMIHDEHYLIRERDDITLSLLRRIDRNMSMKKICRLANLTVQEILDNERHIEFRDLVENRVLGVDVYRRFPQIISTPSFNFVANKNLINRYDILDLCISQDSSYWYYIRDRPPMWFIDKHKDVMDWRLITEIAELDILEKYRMYIEWDRIHRNKHLTIEFVEKNIDRINETSITNIYFYKDLKKWEEYKRRNRWELARLCMML